MNLIKKATLATALAASALASATPAMARDHYRHGGGDTAAWAIGAGILGIAIGAAVASSNHDRDRYDDRRYNDGYNGGGYYDNSGWAYRDGYYWDREGRRYDRYEYQRWQRDHDGRRGYDRDEYYQRRGW